MKTKNAKWIVVSFVLCIFLAAMLHSCVFLKGITSQARLTWLLSSLPEPEAVVLLNEVTGVGGGSDSGCYTAYVHRLYGSDQTAEHVFSFFQDMLLSGNEWAQVESGPGSRKLSFLDRRAGFRLAVDYNLGSYAASGFGRFSEQSLAEAQAQFALPFVLVLNHADGTTREKCWPGREP